MVFDLGSKLLEVKLIIINENVNMSDVIKGIEVDLNERDFNDFYDDFKVCYFLNLDVFVCKIGECL